MVDELQRSHVAGAIKLANASGVFQDKESKKEAIRKMLLKEYGDRVHALDGKNMVEKVLDDLDSYAEWSNA